MAAAARPLPSPASSTATSKGRGTPSSAMPEPAPRSKVPAARPTPRAAASPMRRRLPESGKTAPMSSVEQEWKWAVDGIKECQDHAEKVGVKIAIEPLNRFETYFINRKGRLVGEHIIGTVVHQKDAFHRGVQAALAS